MGRNTRSVVLGIAFAGVALVGQPAAAQTIVTPENPQGWREAHVQGSGNAEISNAAPRSGNGSLELTTTGSGDRARWLFGTDSFLGGTSMGRLDQLSDLSFDWFVSSLSTTSGNITPAFRLHLRSGFTTTQLVWEGAYNGYSGTNPVPLDEWVFSDLMSARFHTGGGADTQTLSYWMESWGSRNVLGISIGVGSGWTGQFEGYADNVTIGFGGADPNVWNFETAQTVTPEPVSMVLLGSGLGGIAAIRRRRRNRSDKELNV